MASLGAKRNFSFNFIKYGHVTPSWERNDKLIKNDKRTMGLKMKATSFIMLFLSDAAFHR